MNHYAILVEPDGDKPEGRIRIIKIADPAPNTVLERMHLDPKDPAKVYVRLWINTDGERAPSGQLVYREELPPAPKEEDEKPTFDELKVKQPLQFGVNGTTFKKMAKKYGKK